MTSGYGAGMTGQRIFLAGVFLTPFMRVLVLPGVGFSVGDALLIAGALVVLFKRVPRRPPRRRSGVWFTVFAIPGALLVVGTLASALFNQMASSAATIALTSQYAVGFWLLPAVLTQQSEREIVSAAKAFLYGLAASVMLGLGILVFLPSLAATLTEQGWLISTYAGRQGLFSGIGELSRMAAAAVPIVYYLTVRRHITIRKAMLLLGTVGVALIITRSGSGSLIAIAAVAVVAVLHLLSLPLLRDQLQRGVTVRVASALVAGLALMYGVVSEVDRRTASTYGQAFTERVTSPLRQGGVDSVGSAEIRLDLIDEGWRVVGDHMLTGIGPGLFIPESIYAQGVHVVPLLLWAETGILPLLGWIVFIVAVAAVALASRRKAPVAAVCALGVLTAFVGINLTTTYMYPRGFLLPLMLAIFLLRDRELAVVDSEDLPPKLAARPAGPGGSAAPSRRLSDRSRSSVGTGSGVRRSEASRSRHGNSKIDRSDGSS
ncbi:hypothetical protein E4P40_01990 [Blastococcus sp. CT_GayMR20]|uniref:O-antigen ligase family protein n=1 Tax=Blastococcus sp. CT_GayMR20 TaxID=2559609 RepID=UPI0010731AAD|nr:O-antigen ligase family protein [Blastococcus sp. CT_GayMR20]TFV92701.1 hypothetical protein E4P40_01870 [Blastococcus sp. CT_GayMR20]TFV92718.1 hypothetical protein E4P40_01990 [Blastococcus sp. CT_GayMR20]